MPDGATVAFPDDMPKEQIRAKILEKFPDAFKQPSAWDTTKQVATGAGRALAGNLADAYGLSDIHGVGSLMGAPGTLLRLSQQVPGGGAARRAVEDFANAPTPGAENYGWWGVQGLEALVPPGGPLTLGAKGIKAGTRLALKKGAEWLPSVAQKFAPAAEKEAAPAAAAVGGIGAKPRLRIKADGSVVEVAPDGTERFVRQWTKRQMEKRALRAQGQPTSSTAPPTSTDVHADYQKVMDVLGEHAAHRLGRHLLHTAGVPPIVSHALMTHVGRRLADLPINTGILAGARTLSSENPPNDRKGSDQRDPGGLPGERQGAQ
jgi:hypothetical protein